MIKLNLPQSQSRTLTVGAMTVAIVLAACTAPTAPTTVPTQAPAPTEVSAATEATAAIEASAATSLPTASEVMTATEAMTSTEATTSTAMVELPAVNPAEVTGNINTGDSSTVYPLSTELASRPMPRPSLLVTTSSAARCF